MIKNIWENEIKKSERKWYNILIPNRLLHSYYGTSLYYKVHYLL